MLGRWREVMRDARYHAFVAHFNGDRDYYECHELMEELWLEEGRSRILQGLLQAAVGLHHWSGGNRSGAAKLMTAALAKLADGAAEELGLDLERLRADLTAALAELTERPGGAPFRFFALRVVDPELRRAVERLRV